VLQAHLDMVGQSRDVGFDFETRPIQAFVEQGWVFADGTTLGADDGIGVAMIMAILQATDIAHGPIEALFTTNEEDGMDGITGLAPDALQGRLYFNVDNENEGSFVISSAGAVYLDVRATYEETATPQEVAAYEVTVSGLIGGHSGIDIDKGRGSAHQLLARLLVNAPAELGLRVASVAGGDTYNVIPRKATAVVSVAASNAAAFGAYVSAFDATVKAELAATDAGVTASAAPTTVPAKVMDLQSQTALIGAVLAAPQGVHTMSTEVPGIVETSCNLGILAIGNGRFTGGALARSAIDSERDAEAMRFAQVFERAGAIVESQRGYASWPPNPESPLLALMQRVYRETFGATASVTAVHAGLETSAVGTKFPGMDMISVGPTIQNVHSPDERLEVASVAKTYQLLVATLAAVE
jgi:dipeptidase D